RRARLAPQRRRAFGQRFGSTSPRHRWGCCWQLRSIFDGKARTRSSAQSCTTRTTNAAFLLAATARETSRRNHPETLLLQDKAHSHARLRKPCQEGEQGHGKSI